MKIFRPEFFGGVLYDSQTLRFRLVQELNEEPDVVLPPPSKVIRKDILSAPVRAYFELTRRCNLACKHCFVSSSPKAPIGESTSNLIRIIDDLADNRVIDVRFTGGELTTRPDWFEVLKHAKNRGLQISVNTNGIYLNLKDVMAKLTDLKVNQVTISIDGAEINHDFMRGKGSFRKAITSLIALSKIGIPVRTNTVLTRRNAKDVPQILETVHPYVLEANFFHMRPVGRGVNQNHLSLSYEEHYHSAKETLALRKKYPKLSIMHFEQSYRERSVSKKDTSKLDDNFSHGNTTINIDCFGGVWPNGYNTYQDNRQLLGNLVTERLSDIWNFSEKLDGLRAWYKAIFSRCQRCPEYLSQCPGLSPEMRIAEINQNVNNNFCINTDEPVPKLYGNFVK
ncbi:MAG: radical SAM protein [Candidatus Woesearchaeota archaeon]|nr:MAG: radical SAM protein [Candidatus Woesearchaeota archaeon]